MRLRSAALMLVIALVACGRAPLRRTREVPLTGIGASLPRALYATWGDHYLRVEPLTTLSYQAPGSGAGVRAITEGTCDFGTSDVPMTDAELERSTAKLLHVPVAVGAVALAYQLPQLKQLVVDAKVLAGIYGGDITRWNDPRIRALNREASLPDVPVVPIYRAGESGTSAVLTTFLAKGSRAFTPVTAFKPPAVAAVAAQGGTLAIGALRRTEGAIAYLDYAEASRHGLALAQVVNAAGNPARPTLEAISAAAADAKIPEDLRTPVLEPEGATAYPLASFSYAIVRREHDDPERGLAVARFLWWGTHDGQRYGPPLGYATLPPTVVLRVEGALLSMRGRGQALIPRP